MPRILVADAGGANRAAFLDLIAWSEIGPQLLAESDDGYNVDVGSTPGKPILFNDYSKHPRILDAALDSTAAGRYQAIWPTWYETKTALNLPDFSPPSQDLFGLERLRFRNALAPIDAGDIASAILNCANEWASFPGNTYGQHEQRMADLIAAFDAAKLKYEGAAPCA